LKKEIDKKIIATNKKAFHDYHILEKYEAGVSLTGAEVKSIRQGQVSLRESFARISDGEAYLYSMHIAPYEKTADRTDTKRTRKLLLHKKEINKIAGKMSEKGYTLISTQLYFRNGKVKLELGLAKGKTLYDKRRTIAEKTANREIEKAFRFEQKQ
jgi:SsrA-binding protein